MSRDNDSYARLDTRDWVVHSRKVRGARQEELSITRLDKDWHSIIGGILPR